MIKFSPQLINNVLRLCYILISVPEVPAVPDVSIPTDETLAGTTVTEDVRTFFPESWIFQLARAE